MTRTLIDDIADKFRLPDLRPSLADYFERRKGSDGTLHPIGGTRQSLVNAPLPFDHAQVWYKVRLQCGSYHDQKILTPTQTVNAMPPDKQWPHGRYDAILVCNDLDHDWPASGLKGKYSTSTVQQLILIIPRFGPCVESRLTKSNSSHHSATFLVNKYFTKDQYYALTRFS